MTDIGAISAALTSIKTATEIAKIISQSGASIEKAELKLRVAELLTSLADAKVELAGVQDVLATKDGRIAELEDALESKEHLVRDGDAYYATNASGVASGTPFCTRCWEVEHRQRHLVYSAEDFRSRTCPACKTHYEGRSTPNKAS
jgi:hypothetical protein